RAAEEGSIDAQCCLAVLYELGRYVEQHDQYAVFWYKKAAENAGLRAQNYLSWRYATTIKIEDHPSHALLDHFGLIGAKTSEIPELIEQLNDAKANFIDLQDNLHVIVNRYGYGSMTVGRNLSDKIITTKLINPVTPANLYLAIKVHNENDLLAIVTQRGRLLIFRVTELLAWKNLKDARLIKIDTVDIATEKDYLVAALAFPINTRLKLFAKGSNRTMQITLKREDIEQFTDSMGKRGQYLPRGFRNIIRLEWE
ncbi:MAG: hypothetical protein PHH11_09085, partial [Methylomonas sp.]|nr:hypothetical protein [Methylomonas sp.]